MRACSSTLLRRTWQACRTAAPTDETVNEPPCKGAVGSEESPSTKVTSATGRPTASAAIWVMTV